MSLDVYGPLVTARDVTLAVKATLQSWLPATLAEAGRRAGVDPHRVPMPVSWMRLSTPDAYKDDQLPAVVVASPGLVGEPHVEMSGLVTKTWEIVVASVVRGDSHEEVADLAALYVGGVELAVLQNRDLGGVAETWGAEGVDAWLLDNRHAPADDARRARTLADVYVVLAVEVQGALDISAGPAEPPPDPYAEP